MGNLRRSRDKIIQELLQEAKEWRSKTYMFQRSNLDETLFSRYYRALVKATCLEERENPNYRKKEEEKQIYQPKTKKETNIFGNAKTICKATDEGLILLKTLNNASKRLEKVERYL